MDWSFDLPTGRLQLQLQEAKLPFEDLLSIGARQNPKRAFLFVSKVLGKHIPVKPAMMRHCHQLLAQQLPAFDAPSLFIGMAETATGLGQGVFEAYVQQQPHSQAQYIHSSRVRVHDTDAVVFEESHSHATRVWLHLPKDDATKAHWQQAKNLILIDDELSTGNTFCNLLQQCLHLAPHVTQVYWVSVADFMGSRRDALMAASELPLQCISLLRGQWQFQSNSVVAPVAQASQSHIGAEPYIVDAGFGRLGVAAPIQLNGVLREQLPPDLKAHDQVLVLGCGEFMHAALLVAEYLQEHYQVKCKVQSTTRSPILQWGAIETITTAGDPYDEGVPYFVYNVVRSDYDHILICHEYEASTALQQTAYDLQADLISLTKEHHA
ncbi:phosphoribosyltransferase domain-containing protein [Vitreoscilla stercoraria]|uniref:Phosphoribosyltransferase family protein n=1 Tax=Vitreoscilla stercoraria TaxID=61 RepID=A0ABY4EC66_VITST|nr:phosphoribosyltransferase domain-containing protein [Vitreoscilla stercoraria]UOO92886.1 phosphoribosyltransferase family protein [Vitreoscilla stercoraria]